MIFSCNSSEQNNNKIKERSDSKNTEIPDTSENKIIDSTETTQKLEIIDEDTIEHDYYSINCIEDFIKFRSHEQLENYFGKDNVEFSLANFGPASSVPISIIYKDYENQVIIIWQDNENGIIGAGKISGVEKSDDYYNLKPGGSKFTYKHGLKPGMSLQELVDINQGPIEFNDFAFSLGRQHTVGMVENSSLNGDLKNYYFHLTYNLPDSFTEYPEDYLYLEQFKTAWSNDNKVNISNIYVSSISYCPCNCIYW